MTRTRCSFRLPTRTTTRQLALMAELSGLNRTEIIVEAVAEKFRAEGLSLPPQPRPAPKTTE